MYKVLLFLALPLMLILTGCPLGDDYPLGEKSDSKLDTSILGTWSNDLDTAEVKKVLIEPLDAKKVKVTVLEKREAYVEVVEVFYGWFTEVNKQKFIFLQDVNDESAQYYTYGYSINKKKMKTFDMGFLIAYFESVNSTEEYRKEVSELLNTYDTFSTEVNWKKEK